MFPIKQSTAIAIPFFLHDVNGEAVTGKLTGDWTWYISKGSGALSSLTTTTTELAQGWYTVDLTAANTDTLGILTLTGGVAVDGRQVNLQYLVESHTLTDIAALVADVTVGSAAVNVAASAFQFDDAEGTEILNDYTATYTVNGVEHGLRASAGPLMKAVYTFTLPTDGVPVAVKATGRLSGAPNTIGVWAYNHVGGVYERIGTRSGTGGSTNTTNEYDLRLANVDGAGRVFIKYSIITGGGLPELYIDRIQLAFSYAPNAAAIAAATDAALSLAHGAGSWEDDWTATERDQIRYRLGLDGATDVPSASPTLPVTLAAGVTVTLAAAQAGQLLDLYRLAGLDSGTALVVTPTLRKVGGFISQTINTVGSTVTVTRY